MCASVDSPWGLGIGEVPLIRDRGEKETAAGAGMIGDGEKEKRKSKASN